MPGTIGDDAAVDSGVDAEPIFEATRVIVYDRDGMTLLPDTLVHFIAPDGHVKTAMTDGEGIAGASTPPDSTIVVFGRDESQLHPLLKIYVQTQPGDTIVSGRRRPSLPATEQVTYELPNFNGAAGYRLNVACALPAFSSQRQITVALSPCPAPRRAIGWAVDGAGAPISGPSLGPAGSGGTIVQMAAYQTAGFQAPIAGTFTNIPAFATDATWTIRTFVGLDVLATEATAPVATQQQTIFSNGEWGVSSLTYRPFGFGPVRLDRVTLNGVGDFQVDAANLPRGIRNAAYDQATNSITWEEDTVGQPSTIVHALVISVGRVQMQVHAPYSATRSITLPPLPPEVALGPSDPVQLDLKTQAIVGKSYAEMLSFTDTNNDFTPVYWDPGFEGMVVEAND
jgi:hypothetical protein